MLRRIRRSSTIALILSPVGVLLLAATRVLILSDYNLSTALAILSSSGYINTLIGSVIPLVPVLMPYIALLLLYLDRVIVALLAFAAALLISPATMSGSDALSLVERDWHLVVNDGNPVLGILVASLCVLLVLEIAGFRVTTVVRTVGTVGIIATLPLIVRVYHIPLSNSFYANVLSQPWLPAEAVTLTTHKVVTGYVLESDQDWFEVLLTQDRTVVHYHTSEVVSRTECQLASIESKRPLVPLVPAISNPPPCPQPGQPNGTHVSRVGTSIVGTPAVLSPPFMSPQSDRKP